jgi:CheY-like chemotaxis protein
MTGKRKKILIVEDESLIAWMLERILNREGYEVLGPVPSGEESLALAAEHSPDVVLMDIKLRGDVEGVEAAVRLKRDLGITSIFITGNTDSPTRQRALEAEPYAYLDKPVDKAELLDTIRRFFAA